VRPSLWRKVRLCSSDGIFKQLLTIVDLIILISHKRAPGMALKLSEGVLLLVRSFSGKNSHPVESLDTENTHGVYVAFLKNCEIVHFYSLHEFGED
jgi:hypothetical protein